MNREEQMIRKRFVDLSHIAYSRGIPMFTDFLSMNEISILNTTKANDLATTYYTFGGYDFAERQMAMFVPDALFKDRQYPIVSLKIQAKYPKFAQEITHRDYLGAMIHLGVDRSRIGDIIVKDKGKEGYVFCHEKMAQFFCDELTQIKHTAVETVVCDLPDEISKPDLQEIKGTVSSLRVDSITALAIHQSRSSISELFKEQKIFINGRLAKTNSQLLKEDDILTIRGYGRFVFKEILSTTKKDRLYVLLLKY